MQHDRPHRPQHRRWKQDVRSDELAVIARRRAGADVESLVGLAISGGGIRSATFALGVLESLRRCNVLRRIDCLSTVSGGGYVGAWLTGNCHRHPEWLAPDPDDTQDAWRDSIAHLRRYSNYLSPTVGFFSADTWSMATIWLRNTLLIQTTVVLALAVVLTLPRPLFELFEHWPQAGELRWLTIALFILGAVGIAGNQWRLTTERELRFLRGASWARGLTLAAALAAAAWAYGRWRGFDPFGTAPVSYVSALPIAALLVAAGFCLLPVGVRLIASVEDGAAAPTQINYDQGWVQRVVIVPLMTAGFLVAAILWGETTGAATGGHLTHLDTYGTAFTTAWRYWPFPLSVVFVSIWLLSFFAIRRTGWLAGALSLLPPLVAVPVLHALLCAVMVLFHGWSVPDAGAGAWLAFIWGPPLVSLSFVLTIVVLIGMMGRQSTDAVREWWSRLGAWLGIYATGWMVIAIAAMYGPRWIDWAVENHPWKSVAASAGWVATVAGGLMGGKSDATGGRDVKSATTQVKEVLAAVAPFLFIAGLLVTVAYVLDYVVRVNSSQNWDDVANTLTGLAVAAAHEPHRQFLDVSLAVLGSCLAALALVAWRVDINEFSLNAFYRNRLVRCYLGATRAPGERHPQNFTGFDPTDDILLKDLVAKGPPAGPLHIVNCALNLGGSSDLALHTRHSASFTLSPVSCGSSYVSRDQSGAGAPLGYVDTSAYGGRSGAPTLGQAISVSGAAASPNMGYHTSPVVAFLLTVFNVRLGWWFPNPRTDTNIPSPRFNLRYLFAELFGDANDKSPFLMISDGGHFENLAAYELIRRRCRVIVISDAECDPTLTFEGLGTLIRVCEVDFNCRITIDVENLRFKGDTTWSAQRFAIGRIDYHEGHTGVLIYLKASMTGLEDMPVRQYKSSHPAFPHESTGDQFYAEDQFESYRRLGQEVAYDAFASSVGERDMVAWAERLLHQQAPAARLASA
ncbi:MAG TPA: patatin-like phospholipase family protein [Vicinamibacterales bacterium]|nr:patatin-like phospholipase family protein [Vicinamibacterales bacterium]